MSAVDDLLAHPDDKPTIELLEAELADEPANVAATGRDPAEEPERKL